MRLPIDGRAHLLLAALCVAIAQSLCPAACAQEWPTAPVQLVVPFPPGGTVDRLARSLAPALERLGGKPVSVENRPGGAGTVSVAKAAPDGHTILLQSSTVISFSDFALSDPRFDAEHDFAGVTAVAAIPLMLIVNPDRYKSVEQLVTDAKAGKATYATLGPRSPAAIAALHLFKSAGIPAAKAIPFRSVQGALDAVTASQVDFFFAPLAATRPFLQGGPLQALATSSSKRSVFAPDIPTLGEIGYKESAYDEWIGVFVPKATPSATIQRIYQLLARVMEAIQRDRDQLGVDSFPLTPDGVDNLIRINQRGVYQGQVGNPMEGQPPAETPPKK